MYKSGHSAYFFLRLILKCFLSFSLCQRQTLSPRKQNETIYAPGPDIRDVLEKKVIWLNWLEMSWITSHGGKAPDVILITPMGSQMAKCDWFLFCLPYQLLLWPGYLGQNILVRLFPSCFIHPINIYSAPYVPGPHSSR